MSEKKEGKEIVKKKGRIVKDTDESFKQKEQQIDRLVRQDEIYWFDLALNVDRVPLFNLEDLYKFASDSGVWDMSMSVFGQRRTGKSTLVKDILMKMNQYIGRISVITDTKQNDFWETLIPEATTYSVDEASEVIDSILKFQNKLIEDEKKGIKLNPPGVIQHTVILDDFAHDTSFSRYSEKFAKIYGTGRHSKVAVILLTQYPVAVGPFVRGNSDFIIVVKAAGKKVVEHIVNDHLYFMPPKAGKYLITETTQDFNTLVVNKSPNAPDHERVFTYKAEVYDSKDKIKLGNPEWRDIIDKVKVEKGGDSKLMEMKNSINMGRSRIRGKTKELINSYVDSYNFI